MLASRTIPIQLKHDIGTCLNQPREAQLEGIIAVPAGQVEVER